MISQIYSQYIVIALAILVLISIKLYWINKSYNSKLHSFIHPQVLLPDIKQKLKGSDPRIILNQSLTKLQKDPSKIRNVAILVALVKQAGNIDPFVQRIREVVTQINWQKQPQYIVKYRKYVLNEISTMHDS